MYLTPEGLREVLGLFPTGIAVVTARDQQGTLYGVTINSFSSVSLDPPLVLFSLHRQLHTLQVLLESATFAIHFLRDDQRQLSARFAASAADKWNEIRHRTGVTGCPVLESSLAVLECQLHGHHDGGDHEIVVARVTHMERDVSRSPLVFFRGRYHTLGAEAPAAYEMESIEPEQKIA
jgi:flavin reductase (DIM6/NTAB) family NADH-FMN oxidoreductase RutF